MLTKLFDNDRASYLGKLSWKMKSDVYNNIHSNMRLNIYLFNVLEKMTLPGLFGAGGSSLKIITLEKLYRESNFS